MSNYEIPVPRKGGLRINPFPPLRERPPTTISSLPVNPGLFPYPGNLKVTEFALKYHIRPQLLQYNDTLNFTDPGTLKSFLTPIPFLPPGTSDEVYRKAFNISYIQTSLMKGNSSAALLDREVFTPRQLKAPNAVCPIHPMLARHRWSTVEPGGVLYPICDSEGKVNDDGTRVTYGVWHGSCDLAWDTLQPSLVLASIILSTIHEHPWFDAFMLGDELPVDPNSYPPAAMLGEQNHPTKHRNFILRPPFPDNFAECKAYKEELEQYHGLADMAWGFASMDRAYNNNEYSGSKRVDGYSTWNRYTNSCHLFLSYEKVALLLRKDLNDADRLTLQFEIANTIMHEMMHAYGLAKRQRYQVQSGHPDTVPYMDEPYFLDEQCAELGLSMESALWGGCLQNVTEKGLSPPLGLGLYRPPMPDLCSDPVLTKPPIPTHDFFRPIQAEFYEGIHQADFWDFRYRSYRTAKPGPIRRNGQIADLYSTKDKSKAGPWRTIMDPQEYQQAIQLRSLAHIMLNNVLRMGPADRADFARRSQQKADYDKVIALLEERKRQVGALWDQAEILSRIDITQGGYDTAVGLQSLLTLFDQMMSKSFDVLTAMQKLDSDGAPYAGCRSGSQEFCHGLRNMVEVMEGSGIRSIEAQVARASAAVDDLWRQLTLTPENPDGTGAADERRRASDAEVGYIQLAQNARSYLDADRKQDSLNICTELISHMSPSLLVKCSARVTVAYNDEVELEERIAMAERAVTTLKATRAPPGREAEQKQVLDLGVEILKRLAIELEAEDSDEDIHT
ncbi:uncharacterized protein L3040_004800 [Drepanopeziza brunnea f. sp. 'multigermtubi']|uniref:Uncharacterized protein n=1 Tax=Marssonina brunnea f. sp. multigermtubi (strain MB_m1) TaxID=1072389 RepID=K1XBX7_MARBU|nr:uncharacterized protein MBM_03236 [Drepanopeziza brunnea f. sp. 'multigermtubi' MB_m1]EKD18243.1 hypothetical protein MBM_03236 [Drepanopeziza brunnea f. sp. 'multigermtubi' MB_m1]KAJ5042246.1 hypothetical protein L3040_004800 [Drepanopeziza brunnea f. sp. 'multigermtubi']